MAKVNLRNVCKSYLVSETEKNVISKLNADLDTGKRIAILGKSGCGKTTLLRIIAGLTDAETGQVIIPEGLRVGYVFQEDRLFPWMTVEENIAAVMKEKDQAVAVTKEMLTLVGMQEFAKAYPHQLSGGMRKKVAFARCLAFRPDWILMDEPFSALDYFERNRLQDELLEIIKKQNKGFLLVTHHVEEAMKLAQEIYIMGNGKLEKQFVIPAVCPNHDLDSPECIKMKKDILYECKKFC